MVKLKKSDVKELLHVLNCCGGAIWERNRHYEHARTDPVYKGLLRHSPDLRKKLDDDVDKYAQRAADMLGVHKTDITLIYH